MRSRQYNEPVTMEDARRQHKEAAAQSIADMQAELEAAGLPADKVARAVRRARFAAGLRYDEGRYTAERDAPPIVQFKSPEQGHAIPEPRELTLKESTQALRRALRAAFPKTKFSVRTGRGTAHGTISIDWDNGPTGNEVHAVADPFEGKDFDGRTDSTIVKRALVEVNGATVRSRCGMIMLHRNLLTV